jgi:hypothetical protein
LKKLGLTRSRSSGIEGPCAKRRRHVERLARRENATTLRGSLIKVGLDRQRPKRARPTVLVVGGGLARRFRDAVLKMALPSAKTALLVAFIAIYFLSGLSWRCLFFAAVIFIIACYAWRRATREGT